MASWEQYSAAVAISSAGANAIVAATAGRKICVIGYVLMAAAAVNVKWQSASTDKTGLLYPAANGGAVAGLAPDYKFWFECAEGEALNLNLSGAVAVGGHVTYILK